MAFIGPDEVEDDNVKPELRGELARARQLVSPDFVKKMKETLKQAALRRIAAEQEVGIQSFLNPHFPHHSWIVCRCHC
jgi:hypothetical protein